MDWANRYYAEPASVRYLAVTDPVRVRESVGQELWLVCVELDARERGGPYMGPRRVALGFGSGVFSAPLERSRLDLRNEDCDAPHFVWRPWSGRAAADADQRTRFTVRMFPSGSSPFSCRSLAIGPAR